MLNGQNSCLIDHICKVRAHCTGCSQSYSIQIYSLVQRNIFCMNFQDVYTSLQIRTVYNNTPVKTSRTKQCRVQNLRTVGCSKDQKSLGRIKSIHFRQKLVQSLFALVIPSVAEITGVSNIIYLINKDNTWGIFLCLFKKIPYTGGSHTYKHLYKVRT